MLLASIDGNYLNIDITNALKNTENQLILLFGEHQENTADISKTYTDINPAVTSATIPETKLLPQLEHPDLFIDAISSLI